MSTLPDPQEASSAPLYLITLHIAGLFALGGFAIMILPTYCESVGCMGLVFMWLVWALVYGALFLLGLAALVKAGKSTTRGMIARGAILVQLVMGILLLGYWALRNVN